MKKLLMAALVIVNVASAASHVLAKDFTVSTYRDSAGHWHSTYSELRDFPADNGVYSMPRGFRPLPTKCGSGFETMTGNDKGRCFGGR